MARHAGTPDPFEILPGTLQQVDPANQVARQEAFPIDTSQERAELDAATYFPEVPSND